MMGKYTKQWEDLKPSKPKRPATKFAKFYGDFSKNRRGSNSTNLLHSASSAWQELSQEEKDQFNNADGDAEYQRQYEDYKARSVAMKRPPTSYALFVRQYWKEKQPKLQGSVEGRRQQFGRIQKRISAEWKAKSEADKAVLKGIYSLSNALFEKEQEEVVNNKRPLNLNWLHDGMEEAKKAARRSE